MDCDKVFCVLTSGPFPTGTAVDRSVEQHLAYCASCYRIAEALRPSAEMLVEAIDPEESRSLPGYWVQPQPVKSGINIATQQRVSRHRRARPAFERLEQRSSLHDAELNFDRRLVLFMVGVILGACLATALVSFGVPVR